MFRPGKGFWGLMLCLAGFAGASLNAQDYAKTGFPPDRIQRFLDLNANLKAVVETPLKSSIAEHDKRIKELTAELADKRKWRISEFELKRTFFSLDDKREALANLSSQIEEEKNARELAAAQLKESRRETFAPMPSLPSELDVGRFGTLDGWTCRVFQIVDGENLIVKTGFVRVESPPLNRAIEVGSREDAALRQRFATGGLGLGRAQEEIPGPTVWIKGLATVGMADGKLLQPPNVFEVTTTKKIRGTQTVYVLEPFNLNEALKYAPKPPEDNEEPEKSKPVTTKQRAGAKSKTKPAN